MRVALVLGGAACVYDDARRATTLLADHGLTFDLIVAANQIGIAWPRITDWVTLHPELFLGWQQQRAARGLNEDYLACSSDYLRKGPKPRIDAIIKDWGGSSGLFGVNRALDRGATHVICAGVPMNRAPHFNGEKAWQDANSFTPAWKRWQKRFAPYTRSMSGWSAEFLGQPDAEFLGVTPAPRATGDGQCP